MSEAPPKIRIYTDGGCDPNPGPGGWGAVLIHPQRQLELSGGDPDTTNNRMELTAAIEALQALKQPCQIDLYTDSEYLRKGITEWIVNWKAKGWAVEIANVDLWQRLDATCQPHTIDWHWVRGHTGDTYNERAHQLASAAIPRPITQIDEDATRVYLRVAGAEKGGKGACGWAGLVVRGEEEAQYSGGQRAMSINQFSLYAALQLLSNLSPAEPLQFFTNNDYLYNGIVKWVAGWRSGGWSRDIQFKDLWQALDQQNQQRQITWHRLRGAEPDAFKRLEKAARAARDSQ